MTDDPQILQTGGDLDADPEPGTRGKRKKAAGAKKTTAKKASKKGTK